MGACFLPGSMIRTPSGDVPVEDVRIGDIVTTFDWRSGLERTSGV
ncbi:Hint domain-containing protein, partial [Acetobacter nitrogenifigens]